MAKYDENSAIERRDKFQTDMGEILVRETKGEKFIWVDEDGVEFEDNGYAHPLYDDGEEMFGVYI